MKTFSFDVYACCVDTGVLMITSGPHGPHHGDREEALLNACIDLQNSFPVEQDYIVRGLLETLIRARLRLITDTELGRVLHWLDHYRAIAATLHWVEGSEQPLQDIAHEVMKIFRTAAERDEWASQT